MDIAASFEPTRMVRPGTKQNDQEKKGKADSKPAAATTTQKAPTSTKTPDAGKVPPATTQKAPVASQPAQKPTTPIKKEEDMAKTRKPWTDAEVQQLRDEVTKHKTKTAAFKVIAEKTGRSPATVSQKWANLNKKESGKASSAPATAFRVRHIDWSVVSDADLDKAVEAIEHEKNRRAVAAEVEAERKRLEKELADKLAAFEEKKIKAAAKA